MLLVFIIICLSTKGAWPFKYMCKLRTGVWLKTKAPGGLKGWPKKAEQAAASDDADDNDYDNDNVNGNDNDNQQRFFSG